MDSTSVEVGTRNAKRNWLWYALLILTIEKTIQHIFVTLAFWTDLDGIRSKVVVSPYLLMIAGATVAVLFVIVLWGLVTERIWSLNLLLGLALFDIFGEFIAQGRLDIEIPLSFIVALAIFVLTLVYKRKLSSIRT